MSVAGSESSTVTPFREAAICSEPHITSSAILKNQPGDALLPLGTTNRSQTPVGRITPRERNVILVRDDLVERRNQVEKEKKRKLKNASFSPGVQNLIHAGDGQLAEAAESI